MTAAMDASTPVPLSEGDWHLPYINGLEDLDLLREMSPDGAGERKQQMVKVSAARCARVSYLTQEGKRDIAEDLRLYDRLVTDRLALGQGIHWSPLEHVATPWRDNRQDCTGHFYDVTGKQHIINAKHLPKFGNLLGWRSLRTEVEAAAGAKTYS
jgi:hypothetical protein